MKLFFFSKVNNIKKEIEEINVKSNKIAGRICVYIKIPPLNEAIMISDFLRFPTLNNLNMK